MRIGSWNIRGLNKRIKQHEVVDFFRCNNLDILGINETRVQVNNFDAIRKRKLHVFQVIHNYAFHPNGRYWVFWSRSSLQVQVVAIGNQWIHLQIEEVGRPSYQITFVYDLNDGLGRESLWSFLSLVSSSLPWVVLGDFNCVRYHSERISVAPPDLRAMKAFNDTIYSVGLEDI
ncbi:hypothetical protein RND81_09G088300 [Saponaria officinalis]|uniref:Endonuclease/exonuclease/phosphatase domain-containing protein n=1 Tax=Saponaria officinalis TaxID=3572 RepID=A0AAW1IKM6_SAPOF